jgi:peroxiredoxin
MAKRHLKPGDPAPSGICLDVDGREVSLEQLWSQGPILLTFLRHFG